MIAIEGMQSAHMPLHPHSLLYKIHVWRCRYDQFTFDITQALQNSSGNSHELLVEVTDPSGGSPTHYCMLILYNPWMSSYALDVKYGLSNLHDTNGYKLLLQ